MILELRNIFKTYYQGKMEVPVLKDVSLSVAEGEYLAIMGPSGSGKTTLMNLIGCLDVPTSGQYLLEGQELSNESDAKLSQVRLRSIGFVFQSFYLLSRQSAVDNVALPLLYAGIRRRERTEKAKLALERVGLGDRLSFKPTQLSGGQCQRVAIARAIVNNPKILLADEPTGALDTKSGEQIMEIFQKLNDEGVTIVMITHEPEIAAHAKRTLHIRDGQLLDAPPAPVVLKQPEPQLQMPDRKLVTAPLPAVRQPMTILPVEITDPFARQEETAPIEIEDINPFGEDEPETAPLSDTAEPEAVHAPEQDELSEGELEAAIEQEIEMEMHWEAPHAEEPAKAPVEAATAEEVPAEAPAVPAATVEETVPEPKDEKEEQQEETLAAEAEKEEAPAEPSPDTALEAEIAALLDGGKEDPFATGDAFLKEAGIEPEQPEAEEPAPETPLLVTKATKEGAPAQISFDIWAEPEPIDVEAIEVEFDTDEEEPVQEEEPAAEAPMEAEPDGQEMEEAEQAAGEPADAPTALEAPEADAPENTPPKMVALDLFDTAFDAFEDALPRESSAEGQFGLPMKTDVDLSAAFKKQEPPYPWGQPGGEAGQVERLIEIEDLGISSGEKEDNV